jgi:ankyrin repeat protein
VRVVSSDAIWTLTYSLTGPTLSPTHSLTHLFNVCADWIFDFVLQFLGSDRFDAAVMDFVDENCHIFENNEENKFIYTDIYQEFLDHVSD